MSVTTIQTLTINPAFLQEIKNDNQQLRQLLGQLDGVCPASRPVLPDPERLVELLGQLRDQIAFHFSLEEAYGYFDDPTSIEAGVGERAEQLRAQHASLYQEIADLADYGEQWLRSKLGRSRKLSLARLVMAIHQFRERLQRHEDSEDELIWMAYQLDIGGRG